MKKLFIFSFIVCLLTMWTIPTQAASTSYEIEELDLSLSISSTYDVFTSNMPDDDPLFSEYGITKSDLMTQFSTGGMYLDAVSQNGDEEIVVTMTENLLSTFDNLDDSILLNLASIISEEYTNFGLTVTGYDIYHHTQLTFIRFYFHDAAKTTCGVQYCTAYDNQFINFTLRSYTGDISFVQEQTFLEVIDSITMHSYVPAPTPEAAPSFLYTDQNTGVTYTVPANWKVDEFTGAVETLDAKFIPTTENGVTILYGSEDIWSQLSATEQIIYSRSDVDNTFWTMSDIAELYGTTASNVKEATYNGKTYYIAETTTASETYGFPISITYTIAVRLENGWYYYFQFSGDSFNEYFKDFEALLNSVEYPKSNADNSLSTDITDRITTNSSDYVEPTASPKIEESGESNTSTSYIALFIVIAVIGCGLFLAACKAKKIKNPPSFLIYLVCFILFTLLNVILATLIGITPGIALFYLAWWYTSKSICNAINEDENSSEDVDLYDGF